MSTPSLASPPTLEHHLRALDEACERCRTALERTAAALEMTDLAALAETAERHGRTLREAIAERCASLGWKPEWNNRQELEALLQRIQKAERRGRERAEQLLGLATHLELHDIRHRSSKRRQELQALLAKAIDKLREAARAPDPPPLPPDLPPAALLERAFDTDTAETLLTRLRELDLDSLADLLENIEPEHLVPRTTPPPSPTPAPTPPQDGGEPTDEGSTSPGNTPETAGDADTGTRPPSVDDKQSGLAVEEGAGPSPEHDEQEEEQPDEPDTDDAVQTGLSEEPNQPDANEPLPGARPTVDAARGLPEDLQSYASFRDHHTLRLDGQPEPAPWHAPGFAERVHAAATQALQSGSFARAWILLRHLELEHHAPPLDPRDLVAFVELSCHPERSDAGRDPDRWQRLQHAQREGRLREPRHRFAFALEVLRPSDRTATLYPTAATTLLDALHFECRPLRNVLEKLVNLHRAGLDPVATLAAALSPSPETELAEARKQHDKEQECLHESFRRLYSGAGGRIQRTHCREAWSLFIEEAQPTMEALFSSDEIDLSRVSGELARLRSRVTEIADRHGVKLQDRRAMDRWSEKLLEQAQSVLAAAERIRRLQRQRTDPHVVDLPRKDIEVLRTASALADPLEEQIRLLLLRVARQSPALPTSLLPLALTVGDLLDRPRLLTDLPHDCWRIESLEAQRGSPALAVADLPDLREASATLLAPPLETPPATLDELVDLLFDRKRFDLLLTLSPLLRARSLRDAERLRDRALTRIHTRLEQLEQRLHSLTRLAHTAAGELRHAFEAARNEADRGQPTSPLRLLRWIELLDAHATELEQQAIEALDGEIERCDDTERRARAREAFETQRWIDAVELLRGEPAAPRVAARLRETLWRQTAHARYPQPGLILRTTVPDDPNARQLLELWNRSPANRQNASWQQGVVRRFGRFVFAEGQRSSRSRRQSAQPLDKLADKGRNRIYRVPADAIRSWIGDQQLNPCFFPQLASYDALQITVSPVPPAARHYARATAEALSRQKLQSSLVLLLEPEITAHRRRELLLEFQRRNLHAAVIDALDLCRLLAPGGQPPHPVLGLLEIAFEQLPLSAASPFELQHGEAVRIEMFVGRRAQADALTTKQHHKLLFSGRKLGKSALLRYLYETQDGRRLPSGNTLHVVYLPLVGTSAESQVAEKIVRAVRNHPALSGVPEPDRHALAEQPAPALCEFFDTLCDAPETSDRSVLLVLDEADMFVESQLRAYAQVRERCLSFVMRSHIENRKDASGLSRVRFVFAGYRSTNTRRGSWGNWGDVMRLDPLQPDEAARLVAGPLARLGLDCSTHARAIAYRCGHQPAVLVRFGKRLLERLARRHADTRPHTLRIDEETIDATFDDAELQAEIRHVTWANFEGSPVARLVFRALLEVLASRPAHLPIWNAESLVLEQLRQHCDDAALGWLCRTENPAEDVLHATIRQQLRNLEERRLLVRVKDPGSGRVGYALRFPHHLPILLDGDGSDNDSLARLVRALGEDEHDGTGPTDGLHGIPTALLEDAREVLHDRAWWNDYRAVVIATPWLELATDRRTLLRESLGLPPGEWLEDGYRRPRCTHEATTACYRGTTERQLDRLLASQPASEPPPLVVGSLDLLRPACLSHPRTPILALGTGRVERRVVWHWFTRIRGYEFAVPGAVDEIMRRTGGIPHLLRALDTALAERVDEGQNVSLQAWQECWETIEQALAERRWTPAPRDRLQRRELELLRVWCLVARYASEHAPRQIAEDMQDNKAWVEEWRQHYAGDPVPRPLQLCPNDLAALRLLLTCGLMPDNSGRIEIDPIDRLRPLDPDDPVVQLAACPLAG